MYERPESHLFDQLLLRVGRQVDNKPNVGRLGGRTMRATVISYVSNGTGWFEDRVGGRQVVQPGTLLLQPAGIWHSHDPDQCWTEYWLMFHAEPLRELFGDLAPRQAEVRHIGLRRDLIALWEDLHAAWPAYGPGSLERACLNAHRLFHALYSTFAPATADTDEGLLREADLRIRSQVEEPTFDALALAQELGVGYHHFRRVFRRRMGVAPKQYWLRLRMERAAEQLVSTGQSIEQIAAGLGYDDPCYFSRQFARIVGTPPGRFRGRRGRAS